MQRCLSIVDRVALRSLTGLTLEVEVHQHLGCRLQLYLRVLPPSGRRCITRTYRAFNALQNDVNRWFERQLDGLATCVYAGLGFYEPIPERAYSCLEVDQWEHRDFLALWYGSQCLGARL